jgi:hypothetical protein
LANGLMKGLGVISEGHTGIFGSLENSAGERCQCPRL